MSLCLTLTPPCPPSVTLSITCTHTSNAKRLCFVPPRAAWHHGTRAPAGLPAHACEQPRFLDPFAIRTLSPALPGPPPRHPALTQSPHRQASSLPLGSPGHPLRPALPTWASSPLPLCPVSKLLPTHLLATCSAQGRGRSGLALLSAKAAACGHSLTLGQNAETCPSEAEDKRGGSEASRLAAPALIFPAGFPLALLSLIRHLGRRGGALPLRTQV